MGCFSYICKGCGTPINATPFVGEKCIMFLLRDGKVVEQMEGRYDGYGRIEDDDDITHEWTGDWHELVDLHFSKNNKEGFAVYHSACYKGKLPKTISEDDPHQGFGRVRKKYMKGTKVRKARR